jgi:hypothetical protein
MINLIWGSVGINQLIKLADCYATLLDFMETFAKKKFD